MRMPIKWKIHEEKTENKRPRRRYQTSEKALRNTILHYLNLKGIYAWKQNTGAMQVEGRFIRFSSPGVSDIIGILPDGRFLAIETKVTGKLTRHQEVFLENIRERGGIAVVARLVDDVVNVIEDNGTKCYSRRIENR